MLIVGRCPRSACYLPSEVNRWMQWASSTSPGRSGLSRLGGVGKRGPPLPPRSPSRAGEGRSAPEQCPRVTVWTCMNRARVCGDIRLAPSAALFPTLTLFEGNHLPIWISLQYRWAVFLNAFIHKRARGWSIARTELVFEFVFSVSFWETEIASNIL